MVGIVVVTHGQLGRDLIDTAQFIVGRVEKMVAVPVDPGRPLEAVRGDIEHAVRSVDEGHGVLILTDMFGGTPCNLTLPFRREGSVDIICGVNLPMMIKIAALRGSMSLADLAPFIKAYGQKNISMAGEIIDGKKNVHHP